MAEAQQQLHTAHGSDALGHHRAIVLFYKYFDPSEYPLLSSSSQYAEFYEGHLLSFQRELCKKLSLKGRVAIAKEGINGTLSASSLDVLSQYIECMESFELIRDIGFPPAVGFSKVGTSDDCETRPPTIDFLTASYTPHFLFSGIDWKRSSVNTTGRYQGTVLEPFPDLKVAIVKEIIASGSDLGADDVAIHGGTHLSPTEFHKALMDNPEAVLVDVRNAFEYQIGHFVHPLTNRPAMNPDTTVFSTFDSVFCKSQAQSLRDKKVLMYCTGGIRCEKASAMLRLRGVKDVSQLQGGIHRYLEEFGGSSRSAFHGLNFVFDQRVAVVPSECTNVRGEESVTTTGCEKLSIELEHAQRDIVGVCSNCGEPYDEYCGSRICTVCRDLVLACPSCQARLYEYHCHRHRPWKECYFTFLTRFSAAELQRQKQDLERLLTASNSTKNVRKTLKRQIKKIDDHLQELDAGVLVVDRNAPRRCRSCFRPMPTCDGRCWGFWKVSSSLPSSPNIHSIAALLE